MVGDGNENEANNRAAWNELQKTFLVELLVEFNRPGTRQQNAWSKVAWNDMARRFKAKFIDSSFSVKQLKEQERTLKKQYKTIQRLRDQSGFGWDPTRKMVVATEEVWAPILQTDKEAKRWYNKSFPYYDDLHDLYSGCIANGSRRRGSNYYANRENQFVMDSPSPAVPAPGGFNLDFEEDYPNTPAFDPISTQAQVPSSTQAPVDGHTPPTTVPSPRRTNKARKRKSISEFHENYLAYKREETSQYCAIMEKNAIRSTERADKFSVAAAIEAYQHSILEYEMADFVYACDMFITKPETREAFISIAEEKRADWIKLMVDLYKPNK